MHVRKVHLEIFAIPYSRTWVSKEKENPAVFRKKRKEEVRESSPQCLPQLFRVQSFIKIGAAVFRLASNTFPAVAIERCGWGWSSFWGRAYSHTEWVFRDCLSRKPYPPCDVTGVKFQCEEGGREGAAGPYLFQLWPMRKDFFGAPACRGEKKGKKNVWCQSIFSRFVQFEDFIDIYSAVCHTWGNLCTLYS